jgi:multiple sugar transport system permease protein
MIVPVAHRRRLILVYCLLILMTIMVVLPFLWALRISLQRTFTTAVPLIPPAGTLTIGNFVSLVIASSFPRWILNSMIVAGTVTVSNALIDSMAGYALARERLPGTEIILWAIIALLMVPHQITLIPLFLFMSRIGLVNTYIGLILPLSANAFGIFVMRQYIRAIPVDYEDAATIDGASRFATFFRVILPLAKPAVLVVVVTIFIDVWNNFIFPLVMVTSDRMKTITLGLADFTYATLNVNWGMTMAGAILGSVPALTLFVVLNRHFMEGLSFQGGIKG